MGAGPYPDAVAANPRVRQSTLSSFASCALAGSFDAKYGSSSHRAGGGTILHRAIAKCLRTMVSTGVSQLEVTDALYIYEEVVRQADAPAVSDDPLADTDVVLSPAEWKDMRAALISWTINRSWNIDAIAAVEERFDVELHYPDGTPGGTVARQLTTQLDLMLMYAGGEVAETYDWKSAWRVPDKVDPKPQALDDRYADADPEGYFQQVVHAVVVFTNFPRVQRVRTVEFYVRHAAARTEDPERDATFHRHQLPSLLAFLASYMERYDKAVQAQVFEPTGGPHCQYCARPAKCTLYAPAKAGGIVTNAQEAAAVYGQTEYLKGLLKDRLDALKEWSEREGGSVPVRTAKGLDKVYGPVLRERTERPSQEQMEQALAAGIDPMSLYVTKRSVTVTTHKPSERHPHDELADATDEEVASM